MTLLVPVALVVQAALQTLLVLWRALPVVVLVLAVPVIVAVSA